MKCPKCGNTKRCKYLNKKDKKKPRDDFTAKCGKCGWKGDISEYYDVTPQYKEKKKEKWSPRL